MSLALSFLIYTYSVQIVYKIKLVTFVDIDTQKNKNHYFYNKMYSRTNFSFARSKHLFYMRNKVVYYL